MGTLYYFCKFLCLKVFPNEKWKKNFLSPVFTKFKFLERRVGEGKEVQFFKKGKIYTVRWQNSMEKNRTKRVMGWQRV